MSEDATDDRSELPAEVIADAERLTRLARRTVEETEAAAYRADRDDRLAEHGFTARVRDEGTSEVLVCYPEEWVEEETIRTERIEDTDRALERRLSGPGEESEFDRVEAHNRDVVSRIKERAGEVHAANARAFADFMGNHYVRRVETATAEELRRFLAEYFPRNAFPSDEQRGVVEESLRLVFEVTDREPPPIRRPCREDP